MKRESFRDRGYEPIQRYHIERPPAVGVLLENTSSNKIILVEQFRYAALKKATGNGWTKEILAGLIEKGESPEACARREAFEETGYEVNALTPITIYFTSIGISDERIHLFHGQVTDFDKKGDGGGVENENEDLNVVEFDFQSVMDMIRNGEINDGKTIIAAQWLSLLHNDRQNLTQPSRSG